MRRVQGRVGVSGTDREATRNSWGRYCKGRALCLHLGARSGGAATVLSAGKYDFPTDTLLCSHHDLRSLSLMCPHTNPLRSMQCV